MDALPVHALLQTLVDIRCEVTFTSMATRTRYDGAVAAPLPPQVTVVAPDALVDSFRIAPDYALFVALDYDGIGDGEGADSAISTFGDALKAAFPRIKRIAVLDSIPWLRSSMGPEAVRAVKVRHTLDMLAVDHIAATSARDLERVREWLPRASVHLFDVRSLWRPHEQLQTGSDGDASVVGLLLTPTEGVRGLEWLLEEATAGNRRTVVVVAAVVGPKELLSQLEKLLRARRVRIVSVDELWAKSAVVVVPTQHGSGTNWANVVALGSGIPLITTAVGAEGLGDVGDVFTVASTAADAWRIADEYVKKRRSNAGEGPGFLGLHAPAGDEVRRLLWRSVRRRHPDILESMRRHRADDGSLLIVDPPFRHNTGDKAGKHVLFYHVSAPLFDKKGSDKRIMQVLDQLRHDGHFVTFVGWIIEPWQENYHTRELLRHVDRVITNVELPDSGIDQEQHIAHMQRLATMLCSDDSVGFAGFDTAILFLWANKRYWLIMEQIMAHLRHYQPYTRIVVATDDVHTKRHAIIAARAAKGSPDRLRTAGYASALRVPEVGTYCAADRVVTVTEDDRKALSELLPSACRERVQPSLLRMTVSRAQPRTVPPFEARSGLLFVGFDMDVNRESLRVFLEQTWPLIVEMSPGRAPPPFYVAGTVTCPACPPLPPGVEWLGHVRELQPLLDRVRVFVSPVVAGTGISTKSLMALENALPLVTTRFGANALHLDACAACGFVREDSRQFAEAVVSLHNNEKRWTAASKASLAHVREWFGVEKLEGDVRALVDGSGGARHDDDGAACRTHRGLMFVHKAFPD